MSIAVALLALLVARLAMAAMSAKGVNFPASAALEDVARLLSGKRASAGAGTHTPGLSRKRAYMRVLVIF